MTNQDVVLMTVDSLRYDSVFNEEGIIKKNLSGFKKLVNTGISFERAFASMSYTPGSVPTILSGSYPWSFQGDPYELNRPHIAEKFKELGYTTAGFQTNALLHSKKGFDRGFDYYYDGGFEDTNKNFGISSILNFITNHTLTNSLSKRLLSIVGRSVGVDIRGASKPYTPATKLHNKIYKWVKNNSSPIFLWIHYMDVHNPWYPNNGTVSVDMDKRKLIKTLYKIRDYRNEPSKITQEEREMISTAYQGSVQKFDEFLDSAVPKMKKLLNDPIICLTSDHGELFGNNGTFFHPPSVDLDLLHIPLVITSKKCAHQQNIPVSTIDIFPTLISSVSGAAPAAETDGIDLFSEEIPSRNIYCADYSGQLRVVSEEHNQVFNIESDIDINENKNEISDMIVNIKHKGGNASTNVDNSDLEERLSALGYK